MTVPNENSTSGPYLGNGSAAAFNYAFKIVDAAYAQVTQRVGVVDHVLRLDVDYSVTGVGSEGGGQVVFFTAPVAGTYITIRKNVPFTQDLNLENHGAYFAEDVERAFDLAVDRDQQLKSGLEIEAARTNDVVSRLNGHDAGIAALDQRVGRAQADATKALLAIGLNFPIPAIIQFEYSPRSFGADPEGGEDSSGAFIAALAAGNVKGHPGDIYQLGNIDVVGGRTVTGNGCQVRPAAGSDYVFRLKGYRPRIQDINVDGFTERHVSVAAATALVGAGDAVISVSTVSRFKPRMPVVVVDNLNQGHLTLIESVNAFDSTITLRDGIPGGTFIGAAVAGSFGLFHVSDCDWPELYDCTTVNGAFSLMMVPTAGNVVSSRGRISGFDVDTERYVGFGKFENTGDLFIDGMRLRGGKVFSFDAVGSGDAGNIRLPRPLYLYRDLTVKVAGLVKEYGTDYVVAENGVDLRFLSGHYPAADAAIHVDHYAQGYFGFVDDQRCPEVLLPSGNEYDGVQALGYQYGIKCTRAFLTDFTNTISDTNSRAALIVDNADTADPSLTFEDTFLGFSPDALVCYGSTAKFMGKFDTNVVPASYWHGNTLGKTIRKDSTAIVQIQADHIIANLGDFSDDGNGELDLNGGSTFSFYTSALVPNSSDQIGQGGKTTTTGGVGFPMPSRGHLLRLMAEPTIAPGVGQSFFYEVYFNGAPSGLAGTLSGSDAFVLDIVGYEPFFRRDTMTLFISRSAGAAECAHRISVQTTS